MDELIDKEVDEYSAVLLIKAMEQLQSKGDKLNEIDEQIATQIVDPHELEDYILDTEELQDGITDKLTRIQTFIELQRAKSQESSSHLTNQPSVSQHEVSTSPPQLVTAAALSNSLLLVSASSSQLDSAMASSMTSHVTESSPLVTTTTSVPFVSALQSGVPIPFVSTPELVATENLDPPPLIPAASHVIVSSHTTQQRPASLSVPAARSLYSTPSVGGYHANQQFATSRLPKLSLPIFFGDPLTWQTFWDSFYAAIHANTNLSGIQKFNYLKAQLQGDAARASDGLPLSDLNYMHSIALLQDRFGQLYKLVNAHMKALLNLASTTNSLASLRMFYDSVESHIRGLSSLEKSEQSYGDLLVPIIMSKLSTKVRRNVAREHSNSQWILSDLMAALQKEIRILESGLHDPYNPTPTTTTAGAFQVGVRGRGSTSAGKEKGPVCIFCKGAHPTHACETVTDHQKRLDIVKQNNLYFNCLAHHKVAQCTSKYRCRRCQCKHHTSLCSGEPPKNSSSNNKQTTPGDIQDSSQVSTNIVPASTHKPQTLTTCLLKTAIATVTAGNIKTSANILFDEGAQRSFITAQLAAELQISPTTSEQVALSSFGARSQSYQKLGVATIQVQTNVGEIIPITVLIVPSIAIPIQNSFRVALDNVPHLRGLDLAHPITSDQNFQISLLIGTDHYWLFVQDHIVKGEGPTAQKSKLGYLLSGPLPSSSNQVSSVMLQINSTISQPQDLDLQYFWSVETIATNADDQHDTEFLQSYQSTHISGDSSGTYIAKFLWNDNKVSLTPNFNICKRRTLALVSKLRQTPELLQLYTNILKEQEKCGFIERVTDDNMTHNVHYLPHHPVKKESHTTPIRIVYDCSCRESSTSVSLNDCLMVGPLFLNELCAILLHFRLHPFAFSTDIEKAFLHVKLHQSDRDYTHFLWPLQLAELTSTLQTYRFTVVPFGTASSPFMLNAAINLHLRNFQCPVAHDIQQNIYVDSILSGCNTETDLLQ